MLRSTRLLALIIMVAGTVVLAELAHLLFGLIGLIVVAVLGLLVTATTLRL